MLSPELCCGPMKKSKIISFQGRISLESFQITQSLNFLCITSVVGSLPLYRNLSEVNNAPMFAVPYL